MSDYNYCTMQVWFYEHNSTYAFTDEKRVPRLSSSVNFSKGKKYDVGVVVRRIKGSEVESLPWKSTFDTGGVFIEFHIRMFIFVDNSSH